MPHLKWWCPGLVATAQVVVVVLVVVVVEVEVVVVAAAAAAVPLTRVVSGTLVHHHDEILTDLRARPCCRRTRNNLPQVARVRSRSRLHHDAAGGITSGCPPGR